MKYVTFLALGWGLYCTEDNTDYGTMRRTHNPMYCLMHPVIVIVIHFVQYYGILRIMEGSPYTFALALLCL